MPRTPAPSAAGYDSTMPRARTPVEVDTSDLSALQARVVREVIALARTDGLEAGDRLAESVLARRIGTSRTPVNVALRHLARVGIVAYDLNRGFFLTRDAATLKGLAERIAADIDDPLYLRLAAERLDGTLPDEINEADLMRQLGASRAALRKTLSRAQEEGWVEKSVGHGWTFLPMIDSPEAYEESYIFRAALEPTGLLAPTFAADRTELGALRRQQTAIAEGGFRTMTAIELFESNSRFHETLARWSGNRFIAQSVRKTDQLRRLVEYRQAARAREPRRTQAREHLQILDAIAAGDQVLAASLMRAHLDGARRSKVHASVAGR
jgi:DNA-binding GntR family transcriptional regulator